LEEEAQSTYNGPETIMQEVSFDSLGHPPLNLILTPALMRMSKKFTATKLEDVDLMMLLNPMEETLAPLMEVPEHAKFLLKFQAILPTEHGLFNGHGSEEPLL
jgi:hypothetical protein